MQDVGASGLDPSEIFAGLELATKPHRLPVQLQSGTQVSNLDGRSSLGEPFRLWKVSASASEPKRETLIRPRQRNPGLRAVAARRDFTPRRDRSRLLAVQVAGQPLVRSGTGESVTVVRLDATIIEASTMKEPSVAGHYKHGIGWHPLTAWCSNTGDHLAVMQRPGNAGSITASHHALVVDAALEQIPAEHHRDVLVTIDGADASHDVIDHLTGLNTFKQHGRRGRRLEYSIGWPFDERTRAGIAELPEQAWTARLTAGGDVAADGGQVAEVNGLLRGSAGGDRLDGWLADMRVIVYRTLRPVGEQAKLGEDAQWRYSAFATNTAEGQLQWLDARHHTQAHIEDKVKELKAMGAQKLPTADSDRNAAWLQLAALAVTLTAWLRHLALDNELAVAEPKTLRFRLFAVPARIVRHARSPILKIPDHWAWADDLVNAWTRIQALQPG